MIVPSVVDDDSSLPRYALPGDAGADLRCREHVILRPGERRLVPTGVRAAIPDGHVGFVNPRSGLAIRTGLSIVNAPGTIDSGYRGASIGHAAWRKSAMNSQETCLVVRDVVQLEYAALP